MLIFLDETFRTHKKGTVEMPFGALCRAAIPENQFTRIAKDIYQLKFERLKRCIYRSQDSPGVWRSGLKVMRPDKKNALDGPETLGWDKKAQRPAQA